MTTQLPLALEPISTTRHNSHETDLITLDRPDAWPPQVGALTPDLVLLRAAYLEAAEQRNAAYERYYRALAKHLDAGAVPELGRHLGAMLRSLSAEIARRQADGLPHTMHERERERVRAAIAELAGKEVQA